MVTDAEVEIVLVHGACHGPWCWEDVIRPLRAAGLHVTAVDLPMTSLVDDANVVRRAVARSQRAIRKVLLVGHSYGGVVITAGGHDADLLMYCAGTMPDAGQAASDLVPRLLTPELAASLAVIGDGSTFELDPAAATPAFFNRCTSEQVERILPRLRPMHQICMDQEVGRPAWREVSSTYVVCSDDFAMAPMYQLECAAQVGDHIVLDTDHSMFYSATGEFVAHLISVASRLSGQAVPSTPNAG